LALSLSFIHFSSLTCGINHKIICEDLYHPPPEINKMATQAVIDLSGQVVLHWNTSGRVHPEVLGMRQDELRNLIRDIGEEHHELIVVLRGFLR